MSKQRILLLGGNFYPEPTGIGKYNGEMMDWLSGQGHECAVVTTFPYYPFWRVQPPYETRSRWYKTESHSLFDGVPIKIYRCPHYVPKVPGGKNRIFSDFSFFISAFFQVVSLLFKKKYDIVIAVAPPFQIGVLGWLYKMVKGAELIYHVQDLQIDAAFELGMIKSKKLVRLMFGIEQFILRQADFVSSISEGMIRKIQAKHNCPVILFPNWADTDAFFPINLKEKLKINYQFSSTDKVVLYSGAVGEKQGLKSLLYSINQLKHRSDIKFIICGSGPYQQQLVDMAATLQLGNLIFMPLQCREDFNQFLNMADVHLVLQKAHANDLVMPSKLTTILSVGGLAIVTAEPDTSLHAIIERNNIGLLSAPEDVPALTAAILHAVDGQHGTITANAHAYAKSNLTINKVVANFFSQILTSSHNKATTKILAEHVRMDVQLKS